MSSASSARCSSSGGAIAKYIDLPLANYATLPYDKVLKDGKTVGIVHLHRLHLQ